MFENLIEILKKNPRKIVYTEGTDARILESADRLKKGGAVAVFCSGSFNYVMNRNVTFKSSSNYARSIAMFVAMYCWNLLFSNLMMAWIPGLLGWPTMAVKIVTMGMQAVWGFLLCRYVIFK